jgi:HSP20 family molecular chaperone IbpA
MWAEALDLLQSAERLQRQFFQLGAAQGAPTWEPPVDLYETGNELWILVALPGVTTDQLEVVIDGATIVVRGERPLPLGARGATILRLEIPYGRFQRRIALPAGRLQILERKLENGCLVLCLQRMK